MSSSALAVGPITTDVAALFPELARARSDLASSNWAAVAAYFGQLRDSDDADFAVRVLMEVDAEHVLTDLARDAENTLARTLLAARLIELGWAARTGYRAQHVSAQQFATFHDYLRRAEQILIELTAREPWNTPAWSLRLMTARGLELGKAEARRRYDQAVKHEPNAVGAQLQLLQQLCPKWSGSLEEMHAFARECGDRAPEGTSNGVVAAVAHLEHWMHLDGGSAGKAYLAQPEVQQHLAEAAARSVWHQAYRGRYRWVGDHSMFAMVFSLAGNYPAAAPHFRALGNVAPEFPWEYDGDPISTFKRHRDRALAKG